MKKDGSAFDDTEFCSECFEESAGVGDNANHGLELDEDHCCCCCGCCSDSDPDDHLVPGQQVQHDEFSESLHESPESHHQSTAKSAHENSLQEESSHQKCNSSKGATGSKNSSTDDTSFILGRKDAPRTSNGHSNNLQCCDGETNSSCCDSQSCSGYRRRRYRRARSDNRRTRRHRRRHRNSASESSIHGRNRNYGCPACNDYEHVHDPMNAAEQTIESNRSSVLENSILDSSHQVTSNSIDISEQANIYESVIRSSSTNNHENESESSFCGLCDEASEFSTENFGNCNCDDCELASRASRISGARYNRSGNSLECRNDSEDCRSECCEQCADEDPCTCEECQLSELLPNENSPCEICGFKGSKKSDPRDDKDMFFG